MPVEIRELVVKTRISANDRTDQGGVKEKELAVLKKQLLEECKRIIGELSRRDDHKR